LSFWHWADPLSSAVRTFSSFAVDHGCLEVVGAAPERTSD
jgi:hypothetical protein